MLFCLISISRDPPGGEIVGKLIIIAVRSECDLNKIEKDETVCLMRCLFLNGAWLFHSAKDARMANMAVGIVVLESVNSDMAT